MSDNLFKKAAVFSDLHFGARSNSDTHNNDCLNYMKWMVEKAKQEGCETCLFLGDYHNNRNTINLKTLNYTIRGLELLNDNFDHTYFISGNHDLFFRDRRDVQSVEWAKHLTNVTVIDNWFEGGNVVIAPWLVGDDHKKIKTMSGKYLFGHFELPGYLMNALIAMPDNGEFEKDDFNGFDHVFSGHFHKRQSKNNITYIGNCFPLNYSDAGDDERGFMVLEWGKEPEFYAWPNQPTYRVYKLSEVLNNTDALLKPNMHAKVHIDVDLSYEEATFVKETFIETYGLREITLIPPKSTDISDANQSDISFESVDQIVSESINNIDSEVYSNAVLLNLYRNL